MFLRRKFVKKIAGKQPLGWRDRASNHSTRISSPRSTLANVVPPLSWKIQTFVPSKLFPMVHLSSNLFQLGWRPEIDRIFFNRISISPFVKFDDSPFGRVDDHSQVETIKIGPVRSSTLFQPLIPFECQSLPPLFYPPSPLWPWQWHRRFIYGSLTFWSTS